MDWMTNSLGRKIPASVEGRALRPFAGAFADPLRQTGFPGPAGPVRAIAARGRPDKLVSGASRSRS